MAVVSLSEITDGDIRVLVHAIQQTSHTGMGKRRIANHGDSREYTRVGSTLRHRDRGPHIDTRIDRTERRQSSQGITADIAKHLSRTVILGRSPRSRPHTYPGVHQPWQKCGGRAHHLGDR